MKKSKSLLTITTLVYIFLVGPSLMIVAASFNDATCLKFPGEGSTLRWYGQIPKMKSLGAITKYSIVAALAVTLIALLLKLPTAYALNRYRFKGKEVIKELSLSPILIPVIMLGFVMLRYVVNRYRLPALPSLLVGHTILSVPCVMRVVTSSLANFDSTTEETARILGAGQVYTFFHTVLPNIKPGVASTCTMAIISSFSNVSLSAFLTNAGVTMLPIEVMTYVEYHFDPTIAALASLLMAITLGVMLVIKRTLGLKNVM